MKPRLTGLMLLIPLVLSSPLLGGTVEEAAEEKKPVDISGKLYLQWGKQMKHQYEGMDSADDKEHVNSFELKRAYLTFGKELDEIWSIKVTLDAKRQDSTGQYMVFIKNAYGQGKFKLSPVTLKARAGMIPNAVTGLIDNMSDYRWLNDNYLSGARSLLYYSPTKSTPGQYMEYTADMGAGLSLDVYKKAELALQVTNGEGFEGKDEKANSGAAAEDGKGGNDDGKAYLGMLTIKPFEDLALAGYYKTRETQDEKYRSDNRVSYYGGTVPIPINTSKRDSPIFWGTPDGRRRMPFPMPLPSKGNIR